MSFDKFTSGLSSFVSRNIQRAEEKLNVAEKTPIDADIETAHADCKYKSQWTEGVLGSVMSILQPNPANRFQDTVLEAFDRKADRSTAFEELGKRLTIIAQHYSEDHPQGADFSKFGSCETLVGQAMIDFEQAAGSSYVAWLKDYLHNVCKPALSSYDTLNDYRLDLDCQKKYLHGASGDEAKVQKYQQAVDKAQAKFDNQAKVVREYLNDAISKFNNQREALTQFLNAQREYHETCVRALQSALN